MDCSRFNANNLLQEVLDLGAEPPIMGWVYTAQNGDTFSVVAGCTGIDGWLLRAVNPLWGNGSFYFIPEGAPVLIPVIPPGQIAERVPDLTMERGYRVLFQSPQVPTFEEPPPFDPYGAVRRWLESLVSDKRQVAAVDSQAAPDLESLEAAFRQTMGRDLFAFLSGVLGVFKEDESPPTVEEFLAAFGDVSTVEMAHFALEVADAADLKYGQMLEDPYALKYHQIPIDQFLLTQGYAHINTTARLREMALGYLMAANIDEMRQEVHDWEPSTEKRLLNDLEAAIQRIPPKVLGLSTEAIREHFSRFHATMTQRQVDLQSYKEMIEAYEKAQEPADWSWLLELGIGLASNLNPVLKGIDLALTLRDVFMTGNMLALGGLVDFIPPSFFRAAGRFLSRLPGTNTIRHLGNDMGAWVDDLARRFGRGAEGKLRFAGDGSVLRMSDEAPKASKGQPSLRTPRTAVEKPHDRHYISKINPSSRVKEENTIIESWVDVDDDIAGINAGKALWDPESNTWSINGRRYKPEGDSSRLMPVDGHGFHQVDRNTYTAFKAYIQYGGNTEEARNFLSKTPQMTPEVLETALRLWEMRRK